MEDYKKRPLHSLVHSDYFYPHIRARIEDPNEKDSKGNTLLHAAAGSYENNSKVVQFLIEQGADVDSSAPDGRTPLHFAVSSMNVEAVDALIEAGASVTSKDLQGRTALHFSVSNLPPGDPNTEIDVSIAKRLLCHPEIIIDPRDENGETPLLWAVKERNSDAVKELLKKGANPDIPRLANNRTAFHEALSSGNPDPDQDIVGLLLVHGASIYLKDTLQQTAMDILDFIVHDDDETSRYAKHVVWLIALRYHIRDCLWRKLEQVPYLHDFLEDCCKEVNLMKKTIVCNNFSLHDFALNSFQTKFCDPIREIYLPVVEIVVSGSFQIYRDLIFCRLSEPDLHSAMERKVGTDLDLNLEPFGVSSESEFIIRLAHRNKFLLKDRLGFLEHSW